MSPQKGTTAYNPTGSMSIAGWQTSVHLWLQFLEETLLAGGVMLCKTLI